MSPRLRRITAKELLRIFKKHGYKIVGQHGSHMHLKDARDVSYSLYRCTPAGSSDRGSFLPSCARPGLMPAS